LAAGRKFIFLVIFDGMDWQTTRAAAIYNSGAVGYAEGRGTGLHFLEYTAGGTSQFGYAVASPSNALAVPNANKQTVINPGVTPGGYNAEKGGPDPWSDGSEPAYLIRDSASGKVEHARPDSASTATALTTGAKTYNAAINVDRTGGQLTTVAHLAQEKSYAVGAVSNVPVSHGTPAATYGHNVSRYDYQDLSRDLLGLPSIAHSEQALAGLDVLIGGGFGTELEQDKRQGRNFVPGNQFLTKQDLETIDATGGGKYTVAIRTEGVSGTDRLHEAAQQAIQDHTRLLGFFGMGKYGGHLPFRTADGDYWPTAGRGGTAEQYTVADVQENPTLADMTSAALAVLEGNQNGFWLMVEAGDVDWANHDNNIDNSIGAVLSGDAAVKVITDWVEQHSDWSESLLIVTSDHGHFLVIEQPEALATPNQPTTETAD
jgi:alkaline phosphatase